MTLSPDQQAAWKAMEEALKPFASNYKGREHWVDQGYIGGTAYPPLTTGDLRRASEALALAQANKPREVVA